LGEGGVDQRHRIAVADERRAGKQERIDFRVAFVPSAIQRGVAEVVARVGGARIAEYAQIYAVEIAMGERTQFCAFDDAQRMVGIEHEQVLQSFPSFGRADDRSRPT